MSSIKEIAVNTLITTDGKLITVEPKAKEWKLEELQNLVGGYIEIKYLKNNKILIMNEEGKLLYLNINTIASELAFPNNEDFIVGNVLLTSNKYFK